MSLDTNRELGAWGVAIATFGILDTVLDGATRIDVT